MSKIIFNEHQQRILEANPNVASVSGRVSLLELNCPSLSNILHEILRSLLFFYPASDMY